MCGVNFFIWLLISWYVGSVSRFVTLLAKGTPVAKNLELSYVTESWKRGTLWVEKHNPAWHLSGNPRNLSDVFCNVPRSRGRQVVHSRIPSTLSHCKPCTYTLEGTFCDDFRSNYSRKSPIWILFQFPKTQQSHSFSALINSHCSRTTPSRESSSHILAPLIHPNLWHSSGCSTCRHHLNTE